MEARGVGQCQLQNTNVHDPTVDVDYEKLGRTRPEVLPSTSKEVAFVTAVVLSAVMSEYFTSGYNIVAPNVQIDLQISESDRTWPAEVSSLSTAALLVAFARLSDQHGGRTIFILGHVWLVIWSLVAGFSINPEMLIVSRALQGVGASAFLPSGLMLIAQTYRPGPRKNLVFSIYGAMAVVGFFVGILFGAICGQLLTWRWYFWIGTILVACNAVVAYLTVPANLQNNLDAPAMDWWGLVTLTPGIILCTFALTGGGSQPSGWQQPYIIVIFVIGALLLGAGVFVEGWISHEPLLPPELFKPKYMKRLFTTMFCIYGSFGIYLFYASYYLQYILKTSPLQTVAYFLPTCIGGLIISLAGGFLLHRLNGRILLIIASLGAFLSTILFAVAPDPAHSNLPSQTAYYFSYIFAAMLGSTISIDITYNVTNIYITTSFSKRMQGGASALINCLVYLGIAFWLGIAELAVGQAQARGESDQRKQLQVGFWLGVALSIVALCLSCTLNIGAAKAEGTADEKAANVQKNIS